MGRRKSLKKKQYVNLYIETDVYQEALKYIDNFSAFVTRCIANQVKAEKKKMGIIEKEKKDTSEDNSDVINCHYSSGRHNASFDAKNIFDESNVHYAKSSIDDATRDKLIDFYGVNVDEIRYICSNLSNETMDLFLNCCLSKDFIAKLKNEYNNVIKAVNYNIYQ